MPRITQDTARLAVLLAIAATASCHSAPFALVDLAATGPFIPGTEARLTTGTGFDISWSADGKSILYRVKPRPPAPGDLRASNHRILDSFDVCPIVLPAAGGSALLEACDHRYKQNDSINFIVTAALNSNGQLLYAESIAPNSRQGGISPTDFPIFYHTALYLADTTALYNPRRLLTLFHEVTGHAVVLSTAVNWLEQIRWIGASRFVALGKNLDPDNTFTSLGIVVGTIIADSAVLDLIPNTAAIDHFAVAGATLVFRSSADTISAMPLAGGPVTLLGAFPAADRRSITDLSCQQALCVVLTAEPAGTVRSRLWSIPVSGGAFTMLKSFDHVLTAARISPTGRSAVAIEGGVPYLLTDVLP
jgi:hypothetical protein